MRPRPERRFPMSLESGGQAQSYVLFPLPAQGQNIPANCRDWMIDCRTSLGMKGRPPESRWRRSSIASQAAFWHPEPILSQKVRVDLGFVPAGTLRIFKKNRPGSGLSPGKAVACQTMGIRPPDLWLRRGNQFERCDPHSPIRRNSRFPLRSPRRFSPAWHGRATGLPVLARALL